MEVTAPSLFDAHVHFRQDPHLELPEYVNETARCCDTAVVMPNTTPPIDTPVRLMEYRNQILDSLEGAYRGKFTPLMMAYLTMHTDVGVVERMALAGAMGFKLYPSGATTNSHGGIPTAWLRAPSKDFLSVFKVMEDHNLVLCLHGELPDEWLFEREPKFYSHEFVDRILEVAPKLRIVFEHISRASTVMAVEGWQRGGYNVGATITLHHLLNTAQEVVGQPLNFCRPCPAFLEDREMLVRAATWAAPGFFLGSDSAPHPIKKKLCEECSAGCYTAPVLLEALLGLFVETKENFTDPEKWMQNFIQFTSTTGRKFYGLRGPNRTLTLSNDTPRTVTAFSRFSSQPNGARPFLAGTSLPWQIVAVDGIKFASDVDQQRQPALS